ncbi:MAG: hypothetical protein EZS28_010658 [Streblomastix strix]|uniref:Histone RNA hairpin-binding protein RNA-binding domain-containing protein n=1 Tax=Streblomastix strix TaxID=222440 RepID=A0A5J4WFK6_9EUKA|nr:MAG: hypothetical protein EZS28_010658 [Streblomastix strix]
MRETQGFLAGGAGSLKATSHEFVPRSSLRSDLLLQNAIPTTQIIYTSVKPDYTDAVLWEVDPRRLEQRRKQIEYGKNTPGYLNYVASVQKKSRVPKIHPHTPNIHWKCSKRAFDHSVRKWRLYLHTWDGNSSNDGDLFNSISPSPGILNEKQYHHSSAFQPNSDNEDQRQPVKASNNIDLAPQFREFTPVIATNSANASKPAWIRIRLRLRRRRIRRRLLARGI